MYLPTVASVISTNLANELRYHQYDNPPDVFPTDIIIPIFSTITYPNNISYIPIIIIPIIIMLYHCTFFSA